MIDSGKFDRLSQYGQTYWAFHNKPIPIFMFCTSTAYFKLNETLSDKSKTKLSPGRPSVLAEVGGSILSWRKPKIEARSFAFCLLALVLSLERAHAHVSVIQILMVTYLSWNLMSLATNTPILASTARAVFYANFPDGGPLKCFRCHVRASCAPDTASTAKST